MGWISYVLKHKRQELADSQTFYSSLEGVEQDEFPNSFRTAYAGSSVGC